jgi:hypothetical protein
MGWDERMLIPMQRLVELTVRGTKLALVAFSYHHKVRYQFLNFLLENYNIHATSKQE